jgi:hypothetical protein
VIDEEEFTECHEEAEEAELSKFTAIPSQRGADTTGTSTTGTDATGSAVPVAPVLVPTVVTCDSTTVLVPVLVPVVVTNRLLVTPASSRTNTSTGIYYINTDTSISSSSSSARTGVALSHHSWPQVT